MEEGIGDKLGKANSSAGGGAAGLGAGLGDALGDGDLSDCSASPEETVQHFLEQVSSSFSFLFRQIRRVLANYIKGFPSEANFEIGLIRFSIYYHRPIHHHF